MIVSTVELSNFINKAKTIHPFHPNFRPYWLQEYKRCIEGYWTNGMYMPGKLYFYINHGTITKGKGKLAVLDYPDMRDVELDFHYTLLEAKGFSGFSDDPFFSSHECLINDLIPEDESIYTEEEVEVVEEVWDNKLSLYKTITRKEKKKVKKEYVTPRTYLRSIHNTHLGKPLFENENKNLIFMAGRGLGKDLEENTIVYKVDTNSIDATTGLNNFKFEAVPIKDIKIGDYILSYNLTTAVKVVAKQEYSDQEMYKITMKNGLSIECGGGHLWLTRSLSSNRLLNTEVLYNHFHYHNNSYNISLPIFNSYNTTVLPVKVKQEIISTIFNETIFTRSKFNTFSLAEKKGTNVFSKLIPLFNLWGIKYRLSPITNKLWCNLNRLLDINKEKDKWSLISKIEKTIIKDSVCIEVECPNNTTVDTKKGMYSPNKLFAVGSKDGEFLVTHNSFLLSHVVLHEWLFDGIYDLDGEDNKTAKAEIIVGASDSKYSTDHLMKVKTALDSMRGGYKIGDKTFAPPFSKRYTGGWSTSNSIVSEVKTRKAGREVVKGSKSTIKHISWNGNAYAAQGGRTSLLVYEEIGMAPELLDVFGATKDLMIRAGRKIGTAIFIGTGGAMSTGGTLGAYQMFYNPDGYNALSFEDEWEQKGSVGYFIPAQYTFNEFRDEYGNLAVDKGLAKLEKERKRITDSMALADEMQNNPKIPSEIFLVQTGNLFPAPEIKNRLNSIEGNQDLLEKKVTLFFDKNSKYNGVSYNIDTENKLSSINDWPLKKDAHGTKEGAIVIYELPQLVDDVVPEDLYIIGHDPFKNNVDGGTSFASIYVLKTAKYLELGTNEIVAEYIGRPYYGEDVVNDTLLKLSLLYGNAKIYFENNVGNTKEYFEKHRKLNLLATKPGSVLTNSVGKGPNVIYGYSVGNREIKLRALGYVRQWLLDVDENGNRNLEKIPSRILLKQFLQFNLDGNFDAVMGFCGCIIGLNERYNKFEDRLKALSVENNDLDFLHKHLSLRDTSSIYIRNAENSRITITI